MDDSVVPAVPAPVSPERQAAEERMNRWQAMPLGHLERAADEEKQAGRWNPQTSALFSELAQGKVDEWQNQVKDAPAQQVFTQARLDLDAGNITPKFYDSVVKETVNRKAKEDDEKSLWEHAKGLASGVAEHPLEVIGAPVKSVMEAGRLMGASAAGDASAGSQIGAALESNFLRGVNMVQGLASYVVPDRVQESLSKATDGLVQQRSLERQQFKANDVDGWWKTYNDNRLPEHRAAYGEGELNKAMGLSASELDKDGVHVSPTDYESSNVAGMGADPSNFIPVHLGASVAANGAKMVLNSTEAGSKVLGVLEKFAGPVKSGTLAPTLETKADAVTRLAADAEKYNTTLKRARVAAGNAAVSAGQAIKTAGVKTASNGMTAAGLAYLAGADPKEAIVAGLAGSVLGSRLSRTVAGSALELGGKVLRSDLPLPLENFRRGYIDFTKDYNVVRAATAGAASGLASSAVFALGADDDQSRADLLLGGAALGAGAAFAQRAEMAISDRFVKSQFGGRSGNDVGPVAPSAPIGSNATADAVHTAAEDRLSQNGLRVSKQARAVADAFGGEFYAASDGQGLQSLHDSLSKTPRDVSGSQGFSISAEDSVTGKPVAASQIGSVNGQSSGHEVGHLVLNTLGAYPEGKVVADNIRIRAAKALGATWDAKSGRLQYSSPMLDAIRDHYQQASDTVSTVSHEYALDEFIAEHFSAMSAGLPAGKMGGSSSVSNAVAKAFFKFGDLLTSRKAGLTDKGVTTSSVLPYTPDIDLFKATQNTVDAFMYEHSKDVPSASMEDTQPIPKKNPLEASGPLPKGTTVPVRPEGATFNAGEGILKPIPTELATDQSLKTSTPPQQARPDAAAPVETAPAEAPAEGVTPQGAIRGQDVQAARVNQKAPLTPEQEKQLPIAQPDPAKRDVARQVLEHINALGGQRVGLPIAEISYRDSTTGKVASKRVAPIDTFTNKDGTISVQVVDLDRADYNAKTLFDWAKEKGQPERFGYKGIDDPKYIEDRNTYLRNQAESRRGGGAPLYAEGNVHPTGEPAGTLTRDQEMFMSMTMGMEPKLEATSRSLGAIARAQATAKASGIEGRTTTEGGFEPNSLRAQLRSEGAPLAKIGADPDPTRKQSNERDRNFIQPNIKLEGIESFKLTGQSTSKPNQKAIEASFMPSASRQLVPAQAISKRSSNEDVRRIAKGYVEKEKLPYKPHDTAVPVREETAKRIADLYDKAVDAPNDPVVKKAYTALANETLKQWKEFEAAGYKAELWTGEGQPYADSAAMMKDVRDNKHIYYFGTEGGFGAGGITPEMRSNPMLAASGVNFEGAQNVPVNDVFRVVHDIVGHGAHGYEFGPKGEFNAYLEHSRMFSDAAKPALAAETLAQNSWVNYGPHLRNSDGSLPKKGERGFIPASERRFADQKNIVIPDRILKEVDKYAAESNARFMPADSKPEDFRAGTVKDVLQKKNWAIFSAENPQNKDLPAAENAARNAKLEAELNERGLTYEKVKGKYNRDENSFIIHGLDQQAALELAKKYDQESILTPKGLTYQDGSLEPALGVDTFAHDKAPDNFFTTLPDGSHASVQLGDKIHPESIEAQSLKASDAVDDTAPKTSEAKFMPADKPTSDEFKNWFGDWQDPKAHTSRAKGPVSYAIDSKGAPLKLVHATRNSFDRFEVGRETINSGTFGDEITQRHAIFLAESPELSNQYVSDSTGRVVKGGRSIPAFASIKSPIDLTRSTDMYALGEELGINGRWLQNVQNHWELFDGADGKAFVEAAKKAGYDGVIFSETGPNRENDHTVYAVFDPEQVKSALAPTFDPKDPARFMPADLSKSKVKGKDVQFKQEAKEGSVGGILEGVHFSSKSLTEIDPTKSFGKGAATSTDRMGEPKVFFYKKNTAYEAPISARSNVYEAKIDGNAIYDYNADPLDVRSIVNREKRDQAIKAAGFKGFYVETPGFDAIAIFDKIGVKESSHENVMSREQLQDAGKLEITAAEAASRKAAETQGIADAKNQELRLAKAKESVLASKGYELAKAKIAKEVGNDYSFEYNDKLDTWADEQAAKKAAVTPLVDVAKGNRSAAKITKASTAQFMPAGETKLEDYVGRNVFALPADRLAVGKVSVGPKEAQVEVPREAQGGRGFPTLFDGRGWAFSSESTASSFLRRVAESAAGENTTLVAISALSEKNALNSPFGQLAVVTAYQAAVDAGVLKSKAMDTTVKEMFERASGSAMSQAKLLKSKGKPFDSVLDTAKKFKQVKSLSDFKSLVENGKINFTEMGFLRPQLDAKTTKVSGTAREAANIDSLSIARNISDTGLHGLPNFSLVALLEIPVKQKPVNDRLHGSYPWSVGGKLLGFFPDAYDLGQLTSDQRIKNKQGTITAQPMQTVLPALDKMKVSESNPNPAEVLKTAKVSRLSSK